MLNHFLRIYKPTPDWPDEGVSTALCLLTMDVHNQGMDVHNPGQLYAVGGRINPHHVTGGSPVSTVEMFDAWHGKWVTCPDMLQCRAACGAAALPDGRLLVTGGYDARGIQEGLLASCEIFDPVAGAWTPASSDMSEARWGHGCASLGNLVYAVGGCSVRPEAPFHGDCMEPLRSVEAYDAATGCWAPCAQLHVPRSGARLAALDDRHLAAIGGCNDGSGPNSATLTSVEIFDSQVGHWALLGRTLSVGRSTAGVAAIGGEEVLAEVYRVPLEEKKEEATTSASAAAAAPQAGNGAYSKDGHPDAGQQQSRQEPLPIQALAEGRQGCQAVTMMLPAPGHDFPLCTRRSSVQAAGRQGVQ